MPEKNLFYLLEQYNKNPFYRDIRKNDGAFYDSTLDNQDEISISESMLEKSEELGFNQEPFEQGITRTLELPK